MLHLLANFCRAFFHEFSGIYVNIDTFRNKDANFCGACIYVGGGALAFEILHRLFFSCIRICYADKPLALLEFRNAYPKFISSHILIARALIILWKLNISSSII